jgi:hypothetical protein
VSECVVTKFSSFGTERPFLDDGGRSGGGGLGRKG